MIRIKRCRDFDVLDALDRACFPADPLYFKGKACTHWWVAWDGDKPAGFCGVREFNDCVFHCRVGVLPAYRGTGLQRRFIRVRERLARKLGYKLAISYVQKHNPKSANNLIKEGYRLYLPSSPWGDEDSLYFRKAI